MNIRPAIANASIADARAALYYASRYVKQASDFDEDGKDVFEDGLDAAPSQFVLELTWCVVRMLEADVGNKAVSFSDDAVVRSLDHLTAVERELDPVLSDDLIARAQELIDSMESPPLRPPR